MFKVENGVIYLTRGDSASLDITLTDQAGEAYTMQTGDKLTLTVKTLPGITGELILQKESTTSTITLAPSDTSSKAVGQYSADIQLTLLDGHIFTVWPDLDATQAKAEKNYKNFWITPEVTT